MYLFKEQASLILLRKNILVPVIGCFPGISTSSSLKYLFIYLCRYVMNTFIKYMTWISISICYVINMRENDAWYMIWRLGAV